MADWASTERIKAEILLAEGRTLAGELHLQARVAQHDGPETPLEMLNRPDAFFPVTLDDGRIGFIAKSQVSAIRSASAMTPADPERVSAAKTIGLEVVMAGGAEYRGWAALELPPTRARTLDYLNASGLFFMLESEDAAWFIHREYVRMVRPLD